MVRAVKAEELHANGDVFGDPVFTQRRLLDRRSEAQRGREERGGRSGERREAVWGVNDAANIVTGWCRMVPYQQEEMATRAESE